MKKFLALLLALVMVFALAACGGTEPTPPDTPPTLYITTPPQQPPGGRMPAGAVSVREPGPFVRHVGAQGAGRRPGPGAGRACRSARRRSAGPGPAQGLIMLLCPSCEHRLAKREVPCAERRSRYNKRAVHKRGRSASHLVRRFQAADGSYEYLNMVRSSRPHA